MNSRRRVNSAVRLLLITWKHLVAIIFASFLVIPVAAQNRHPKLATQDAPSLQILSVAVDLNYEKRTVTLWLEVENRGNKTIRAVACVYRTKDVIRGYNVSITANLPDVAVNLAPNAKKKLVVLDNAQVPVSILNMPVGEITIASITFEDGSSWKRMDDN
jgi:hypothetical protein